jgi:nicotinamide mononucleotide transporter
MDLAALLAVFPWEGTAVVLAIAYLLLAAREHSACWICALLSTAIYTVLFWNVSLLMESALNAYYLLMAVYGWLQWRYGGAAHAGVRIQRWSGARHVVVIAGVMLLAGFSGYLLGHNSTAAWPYVDSFTTWGAVVATVMVAHKVLENWIYWFVIDLVSIPLYVDRGLMLTAWLFVAYLVIVVFGFRAWLREYRAHGVVG